MYFIVSYFSVDIMRKNSRERKKIQWMSLNLAKPHKLKSSTELVYKLMMQDVIYINFKCWTGRGKIMLG